MADTPEMRVGDAERSAALDRLGRHFADGYLDVAEFDARTAQAAGTKTRGELESLFRDLPEPSQSKELASPANTAREAELERKLRVKRNCDRAAGLVVGFGAAVFFLLQFVFDASMAWVAWPIVGVVCLGIYSFADISEEEYDALEELEEKDNKERAERLRIAYERRKELGK